MAAGCAGEDADAYARAGAGARVGAGAGAAGAKRSPKQPESGLGWFLG